MSELVLTNTISSKALVLSLTAFSSTLPRFSPLCSSQKQVHVHTHECLNRARTLVLTHSDYSWNLWFREDIIQTVDSRDWLHSFRATTDNSGIWWDITHCPESVACVCVNNTAEIWCKYKCIACKVVGRGKTCYYGNKVVFISSMKQRALPCELDPVTPSSLWLRTHWDTHQMHLD